MKQSIIAAAIAGGLMAEADAEVAAGAQAPKKKEKPKVSVTMQDSRIVEFPEDTKAKKAILFLGSDSKHYEKGDELPEGVTLGEAVGVRWDFSNGQTRTVLLTQLQALATGILACHGLSQKGGDEYASEKDVDDAVLAFDDLMDRLKKGEWSERREGGGFGGASVLAKAIMEVFKLDQEQVRAYLRDLKPAEKMALRQAPELKPTIEKLEAEKAQGAKVDTKGLLSKLPQAQPAAA